MTPWLAHIPCRRMAFKRELTALPHPMKLLARRVPQFHLAATAASDCMSVE